MKTNTIIVLSIFALLSCRNNNLTQPSHLQEGEYNGHFIRSSPLARYAPSTVTVTFKDGKFSGESEKVNYPAVGNGTVLTSITVLQSNCFFRTR